jgi:hypothetical protein
MIARRIVALTGGPPGWLRSWCPPPQPRKPGRELPRRQEPPPINVDREALRKAAEALREATQAQRDGPKPNGAGGALSASSANRHEQL